MAYGSMKTIKDWQLQVEVNRELWGKDTCGGGFYKRWLEYYERKLEHAESLLAINPQNTLQQSRVAMLKKKVEEYRHYEELYP